MLSSSSSEDLSEKENTPPTESTPLPSEVSHQPNRNERIADWLENQPDITIQKLQEQQEDDNPEQEILLTAVSDSPNDGTDSDATLVSEDTPFDPAAYLAEKQSDRQEVPVTDPVEPRAENPQEEQLPALSLIGSSVFDNSIAPIKTRKRPKLDLNYLNRLARGEQPESIQSNKNTSINQNASNSQNDTNTSKGRDAPNSRRSEQNNRNTSRSSSPDSSLAGSRVNLVARKTKKTRVMWTLEEDEKLKKGHALYGTNWVVIKNKYFRICSQYAFFHLFTVQRNFKIIDCRTCFTATRIGRTSI